MNNEKFVDSAILFVLRMDVAEKLHVPFPKHKMVMKSAICANLPIL